MASHTVIEEVEPSSDPTRFDHELDRILEDCGNDGKAFLALIFSFVDRRTDFFRPAEASKELARLLRDVRQARGPPAARTSPAPAPVTPPAAKEEEKKRLQEPSAAIAQERPASSKSEDKEMEEDEKEDEGKGLKPNEGNGADLDTYSWTQTLQDVQLNVPMPPGIKGRACDVQITKNSLRVGVKGEPPILEGELDAEVKQDACMWSLDGGVVEVTLQKRDQMSWWKSVIKGRDEINTQKVQPENSKLSDLDGETRQTVEKMMFDQRQKALGLPTSEDAKKQEAIRKIMAAHPEMDFSNAKIM